MPLTAQQASSFKTGIAAALASGKMNAWQTGFLTDMQSKIDRYGTRTKMSAKQFAKLQQITVSYQRAANADPRKQLRSVPKSSNPIKSINSGTSRAHGRRRSKPIVRSNRAATKIFMALTVLFVILAAQFNSTQKSMSPTASFSQSAQIFSRNQLTVTDGDTIKIVGDAKGTRLIGFNTPETFRPVCKRGLELGRKATRRLQALVSAASVIEVEKVACACKPGTRGTNKCNYGRSCGILRVDGQDVGPILISEGLAAAFRCGATSCPRTPRPWCN